jgi:Predicted membrane protein
MYVTPRPRREDDPYHAVRLGLAVACGFIAIAWWQPTMPALLVALPLALIASQRKAFNPVRAIGGPIGFMASVYIVAYLVAATREAPAIAMTIIFAIFFLAFYVIRRTGSPAGMLALVAAALMSIGGAQSGPMLVTIRNAMIEAGMLALILSPLLALIVPAAARERHVNPRITAPGHYGVASAIRAFVLLCLCLWLYTVLSLQDMVLAIAAIFPLVFPTRHEAFAEAAERIAATVFGAIAAAIILVIFAHTAHFVVLVGLVFLCGLYFGEKMIEGKRSASVYQFSLSVAVVLVATSLSTAAPGYAATMRIVLTVLGAIGASLAVAVLDAIFLRVRTDIGDYSPHPAIQRRRFGHELVD